jgi:hypothetical protein
VNKPSSIDSYAAAFLLQAGLQHNVSAIANASWAQPSIQRRSCARTAKSAGMGLIVLSSADLIFL